MTSLIPKLCITCVTKAQAQCPHLHVETVGSFHFSEGDVWDDIHDICLDCGADLTDVGISLIDITTFDLPLP